MKDRKVASRAVLRRMGRLGMDGFAKNGEVGNGRFCEEWDCSVIIRAGFAE